MILTTNDEVMNRIILFLSVLVMFSCEADKYQATQQNVEFTLIRNFTMDSIDFRDLEESYFIDIPIAFTDSVEKVAGNPGSSLRSEPAPIGATLSPIGALKLAE